MSVAQNVSLVVLVCVWLMNMVSIAQNVSLIVSVCVWLTVMACVLWNSSVHPFSNKQLLWKRLSFAFLGYSNRN